MNAKKIVSKIAPKFVKEKIKEEIYKYKKGVNERVEKSIPKVDVEEKHIEDTEILVNREKMLEKLGKAERVAEIGVARGTFSEKILSISDPEKLYLVDMWGSERYNEEMEREVKSRFEKSIKKGKITVIKKDSLEACKVLDKKSLDWVYIDTTHTYNRTMKEIKSYSQKVKKGGLIMGHDYVMGNWINQTRYGVVEAVHKFCVEEDWKVKYLTSELSTNKSFAIKKI